MILDLVARVVLVGFLAVAIYIIGRNLIDKKV